MAAKGTTKAILRKVLLCRGCGATFEHTKNEMIARCPYCGKKKDARIREKVYPIMDSVTKEQRKKWKKKANFLFKKRVFFKISSEIPPRCARCGCDDIRILEVNHKNGGGTKERRERGINNWNIYSDILNGKRETSDFEILCKPCNMLHYCEIKFGKLPMRVVWKP